MAGGEGAAGEHVEFPGALNASEASACLYSLHNRQSIDGRSEPINQGKLHLIQESGLESTQNPANRRRSERVVLQMRITVIAEDLDRQKQQEEALTQVVNAHGGLIKMKMELHVGQPMLLVNPKNKVEQTCRVVRVDDRAEGDFSVAFEFDQPNPKFWPVVFPPEDWNAPRH
jgi:hypothetical protein